MATDKIAADAAAAGGGPRLSAWLDAALLSAWLDSDQASYGLVQGQANLQELTRLIPRQVRLLSQSDDRWLVEVSPRAASQPASRP